MPEIGVFAKGYNHSFEQFKAYGLTPKETEMYELFRFSDKQSRNTRAREYTPVFFITSEEGTALVYGYSGLKIPGDMLPHIRNVRNRVPKGGPNREIYDWQLIVNDDLARLAAF